MSTLLILAPSDPVLPLRCMLVDAHGAILDQCLAGESRPLPASFQHGVPRTVLAVPGTDVRTLWLDLPARDPLQALAAAHQLLEAHGSDASDSQHVALDARHEAQPRLVAVAGRRAMHDWLQRCASIGIVPGVLLPDHLLLPVPAGADDFNVAADADRWLVRGATLAFSAEAALARQVLEPRQVRIEPDPEALERLLAQGAVAEPAINLMQYDFAPAAAPHPGPTRRRLAVLALALLVSPAVLMAAEAARYQWVARSLERDANDLASSMGAAGGVDAATSTATGMAASPAAQSRARNALFEAVSRSPGIRLHALRYSAGNGVEADVVHADPARLQQLADALLQSGFGVEAGASVAEGSELRTPIRMEPQP